MNVFIDLGAYTGDSIEQFYNWFKLVDDPTTYQIYGFEPNNEMCRQAKKKYVRNQNVKLQDLAAWIEDGMIDFAVDDIGSTVMKSKVNWETSKHIKVKCFDFSAWLTQFKPEDKVILKMDIEGAEFPVLKKMLKDGTDKLVDLAMIEFHPNKVRDYTTTDKNDLIQRLRYRGMEVLEWH